MVAHLYRVAQDAAGNVLIGAQVSVCQPGSDALISELLFADAGISVPQTNPYTSLDGVIDFYLEFPRTVKLKLDYGGQVRVSDYLDVLPPAENILANLDPVRVINQAFAGAVLTMTDQSTAEWSDLGGGGGGNVVTGTQSDSTATSITSTLEGGSGNSRADGANSIAIGEVAYAVNREGIAIGVGAVAGDNTDSTTIANSQQIIAIGCNAWSRPFYGIAIGSYSLIETASQDSVAIGHSAQVVDGLGAVAIGPNTTVGYDSAIAIGRLASVSDAGTDAVDGIAIGTGSGTYATRGIAIGRDSIVAANGYNGIAIGNEAQTSAAGAIAIGSNTTEASAVNALAIGNGPMARAAGSIAIGCQSDNDGNPALANTYATDAIVIGSGSANGAASIAIGRHANASGDSVGNDIAIGNEARANTGNLYSWAIGIGYQASAGGDYALALGATSSTAGLQAIAVGRNARALANDTVVIGANTFSDQARSIALGSGAQSQAYQAIAIGYGAGTTDTAPQNSVSIGVNAEAGGYRSITIGETGAQVGDRSIALGYGAGSVAPGNVAVGDAVAIGTDAYVGAYDGVAIGHVAQGYALSTVAVGPHTQANDDYAVNVGSCSDGTKGAHGKSSVAIGADAKTTTAAFQGIALGRASSAEADGAISIGASLAMGEDAIAVGTSAQANGNAAIGLLGTANFNDSVAIGIGSAATAASDFVLGAAAHKVKIAGRLNVAQRTPTGSADAQGAVGDITSDGGFVYVKTATGWKRAALSTF
jgi:hypothetical protein